MSALHPHARRFLVASLVASLASSGCSAILTHGPPRLGESDYDPTGAYPGGVPCTSSRTWPLVDTAFLLAALAGALAADNQGDRIDGGLTAAGAALSVLIGYHRTSACRRAQASAIAPPAASPGTLGFR